MPYALLTGEQIELRAGEQRVVLAEVGAGLRSYTVGDQDVLDGYAADLAVFVVDRYGDELATVITDTIERWDGNEAAGRIELLVGRDLQFIRINGTLVGGLAGMLLYLLGGLF